MCLCIAVGTRETVDMRHIREDARMPEWLIGLVIALVLTIVGYIVLRAVGAGDDPTLSGALAALV